MNRALYFIIVLCVCGAAHAQTLSIFDINAKGFPIIRAKVLALDSLKVQVRDISPTNLRISENGVSREILSVACSPDQAPAAISFVISLDISGSMNNFEGNVSYFDIARMTASTLITEINWENSEFAVHSCNDKSTLNLSFGHNKDDWQAAQKLIQPIGNNDFVEHLLNPTNGAINVAKKGKYKKYLIVLTDGWDSALSPEDTKRCVDTCNKYGIVFYAAFCSGVTSMDKGIVSSLKQIAESTGGEVFEGITDYTASKNLADYISGKFDQTKPCDIEWKSDVFCSDHQVNVQLQWDSAFAIGSYKTPPNAVAALKVVPPYVCFAEKKIGIRADTLIMITAGEAPVKVSNIICSSPYYYATPKSFNLGPGQSIPIRISFTPPDSDRYFNVLSFVTGACQIEYFTTSSYSGKKNLTKTLKLLMPNGGEKFAVGADTTISWTGILPGDTAKLEYSTNGGSSWNLLTDRALGLKYDWKGIPGPGSENCLVRIALAKEEVAELDWTSFYGGDRNDAINSVLQTKDGCYLTLGETWSNNGDVPGNKGGDDFWVQLLDKQGKAIWKKNLGGLLEDRGIKAVESDDGGFILGGTTKSNDEDINNKQHGKGDFWLVKLNRFGNVQWAQTYGGSEVDGLNAMSATSDGGVICVGYSFSRDGDVSYNAGNSDVWILKVDAIGAVEWQQSYGGSKEDFASSVCPTEDGGYIVAASSNSYDGDVSANYGSHDCWIIKLNHDGRIDWEKNYGGSNNDYALSIVPAEDGGFVFAGPSLSTDRDLKNNQGWEDAWIVKINESGALVWARSVGGSEYDKPLTIIKSTGGDYFICGTTNSYNGDIKRPDLKYSFDRFWLAKFDAYGNYIWSKLLCDSLKGDGYSLSETNDGGIIAVGAVVRHNGVKDGYLAKLKSAGPSQADSSDAKFSIIEPRIACQNVDMGDEFLGAYIDTMLYSYIINDSDVECKVKSIRVIGENQADFTVLSKSSFTLKPHEKKAIEFRFKPLEEGDRTAKIEVSSQSSTTLKDITGYGVRPRISVVRKSIDFGAVEAGASEDTTLFVLKNETNYAMDITDVTLSGENPEAFEIVNGNESFILNGDDSCKLTLRFNPKECKSHRAALSFFYRGTGSPVTANLSGEGKCGGARLEKDSAYPGEPVDIGLIFTGASVKSIKNLAKKYKATIRYCKAPLAIKNTSLITQQTADSATIEIIGDIGVDSLLTQLEYTSNNSIIRSTELKLLAFDLLNDAGEIIPYTASLEDGFFALINRSAGVYVESDSAYPGDRVTLAIMTNKDHISSLKKQAASFKATIRFENSLLAPVDNSIIQSKAGDSSYVYLEEEIGESDTLRKLDFIAGLGRAGSTSLEIIDFSWLDSAGNEVIYSTNFENGLFKLLGVCGEGGSRLFNPSGKAEITELSPNPASDRLLVKIRQIEEGESRLTIYNGLGEEIASSSVNGAAGEKAVLFNLSDCARGVYFIKLQSPTTTAFKKFIIN